MPPGGPAADEEATRIAPVSGHVAVQPSHPCGSIVPSVWKVVAWRETVTEARECHAGGVESRRHEREQFLVSIGPAATNHESEHGAIGFRGREEQQALVGVFPMPDVDAFDSLAAFAHLAVVDDTVL